MQEALTNIHRHSGSPIARIRIFHDDSDVHVEVQDRGKGLSPEKRLELESASMAGVGIRGMRERVRQLGGSMEVASGPNGEGTVIVVRLPIDENSVAPQAPGSNLKAE